MTFHFSDQEFRPLLNETSEAATVTSLAARREKTPWQKEIVDTLCRYLELPVGWDGYRGQPLRHETGMFVLQVLNDVMDASIPTPQIVPTADGGVQVEWHQNGLDIELFAAAPYECELYVHDHHTGAENVAVLKDDFKPLDSAIRNLVDYNKHLYQIGHAG